MQSTSQTDAVSKPLRDIASLTHSEFAQNLGTFFAIDSGEASVIQLKLIEVSELKESPRQERFALLFQGPLDFPLWQRMYRMDHEQMGSFDLFITPVGKDDEGFDYEAVFNRTRKAQKTT